MTINTEADNDKRLILSVTCTWMRISLTIYNTPEHLLIVLYKYKPYFLLAALYLALYVHY